MNAKEFIKKVDINKPLKDFITLSQTYIQKEQDPKTRKNIEKKIKDTQKLIDANEYLVEQINKRKEKTVDGTQENDEEYSQDENFDDDIKIIESETHKLSLWYRLMDKEITDFKNELKYLLKKIDIIENMLKHLSNEESQVKNLFKEYDSLIKTWKKLEVKRFIRILKRKITRKIFRHAELEDKEINEKLKNFEKFYKKHSHTKDAQSISAEINILQKDKIVIGKIQDLVYYIQGLLDEIKKMNESLGKDIINNSEKIKLKNKGKYHSDTYYNAIKNVVEDLKKFVSTFLNHLDNLELTDSALGHFLVNIEANQKEYKKLKKEMMHHTQHKEYEKNKKYDNVDMSSHVGTNQVPKEINEGLSNLGKNNQ